MLSSHAKAQKIVKEAVLLMPVTNRLLFANPMIANLDAGKLLRNFIKVSLSFAEIEEYQFMKLIRCLFSAYF